LLSNYLHRLSSNSCSLLSTQSTISAIETEFPSISSSKEQENVTRASNRFSRSALPNRVPQGKRLPPADKQMTEVRAKNKRLAGHFFRGPHSPTSPFHFHSLHDYFGPELLELIDSSLHPFLEHTRTLIAGSPTAKAFSLLLEILCDACSVITVLPLEHLRSLQLTLNDHVVDPSQTPKRLAQLGGRCIPGLRAYIEEKGDDFTLIPLLEYLCRRSEEFVGSFPQTIPIFAPEQQSEHKCYNPPLVSLFLSLASCSLFCDFSSTSQNGYGISCSESGASGRSVRVYFDTSKDGQDDVTEDAGCDKPSLLAGHRHRHDLLLFSCVAHQHISTLTLFSACHIGS